MPDRQDDLNPASDLAPFAEALKRLAPQPAHLSRDALLFEAGKASAGSRVPGWAWPSAAAVFAALSVVLAAFLISPDNPTIEYRDRVVYVNTDSPAIADSSDTTPAVKSRRADSAEDLESTRMLQVRRDVLRFGVDMLPQSRPADAGPSQDVTARELDRWLNLPPGTFATMPAAQPKKPAAKDEDEK